MKMLLPVTSAKKWPESAMLTVNIAKNLGRLWLAYTELQVEFTCYNSYLLTLTMIWGCSDTLTYWKGSWAYID